MWITLRREDANFYYNMISKVMMRLTEWCLFTLQFMESRWTFDRRLRGDDEQRVGGGRGERWKMENWHIDCCTNNNQWRSIWGQAADGASSNDERNEKLKMSDLIIFSSAVSVMHGRRPACLGFVSLEKEKKKPDKLSRSQIENGKDDRGRSSIHWPQIV